MLKNLIEYRFIILVVLAIILYAALEWQKFKTKAYILMLQAKSMAKDLVLKSGSQQEAWVINKCYIYMPPVITKFISKERMKIIIHYLYVKAKDYLDDGKLNNSI